MISVDGISMEWDGKPLTIYQFLSQQGIFVPCFCYHEKLNIAGNCRMCLVEANGAAVVSCAMPLSDSMLILTSSERLSHCRENVLEFLLANHPLDCPICDQGGECDLQDISKTFGLDRGRFYESKRSLDNLNCFGPLVKTLMTRCIHCTRCVRFLTEYCDEWFLGVIGRGSSMEIGSFTPSIFIEDALSANVIDLCPVGALTSMPFAFTARPWECKAIESIDIMDSLAGGIRFDVAHNKVVRCLPLMTEALNEDWMTNKARVVYYVLQRQLTTSPLLKINDTWVPVSWRQAAIVFLESIFLKNRKLSVRTGNFIDLETAALLKTFCQNFRQGPPSNEFIRGATASFPELFLFNCSLAEFEESSLVLLVGCNLRKENPLIYLRLRRSYLKKRSTASPLKVYSIGAGCDYDNLPIIQLGCSVSAVEKLVQGRLNGVKDFFFRGFVSPHLWNIFKAPSVNPKVLVGPAIFHHSQASELQKRLWNFCHFWQNLLEPKAPPIYNAVLDYLGKLSMFAVDCVSSEKHLSKEPAVIWNFTTETSGRRCPDDLVVYQGFAMPSSLSSQINLFLPTAAPLEKSSYYLNLLGLVRTTKVVLSPLKTTYTDPQIVRFLHRFAYRLLLKHPYRLALMIFALRLSKAFMQFPWQGDFAQGFAQYYNIVLESNWSVLQHRKMILTTKLPTTNEILDNCLLGGSLDNYYSGDVFSRMSPVLGSCAMKCVSSNFAKRIASSV